MAEWKYQEQKLRISDEVIKAITDAGGSIRGFNIAEITEFLYAAQCNNIEIYRDGMYGAYHVKHTPYNKDNAK